VTSTQRADSAQPATSAPATEASRPIRAAGAGSAQPSIGELVQQASGYLSTMVHGEIELAKAEITSSVKNAGTGAGFFIGAAVGLVYAVLFILVALAEGLVALGLSQWAAFLIVFGLLCLIVAILAWLGIRKVKKVKAPELTISETKETAAFLRNPTQYTS
jgi:uncharacterized membrane protein YqjE